VTARVYLDRSALFLRWGGRDAVFVHDASHAIEVFRSTGHDVVAVGVPPSDIPVDDILVEAFAVGREAARLPGARTPRNATGRPSTGPGRRSDTRGGRGRCEPSRPRARFLIADGRRGLRPHLSRGWNAGPDAVARSTRRRRCDQHARLVPTPLRDIAAANRPVGFRRRPGVTIGRPDLWISRRCLPSPAADGQERVAHERRREEGRGDDERSSRR
jgi:hypothetical protein